ncbi:PKD domain-containing protein [Halococcoides cellulosivorans]|uniref:PKD domain-containing protein n=1 Tax=Halococcoides cellulosivorans TaxID=1679096 RepID=A0A2R4WZK7_9EURY|nr:PKD domain-containing protein [Halococcoides cellulosivorans]AWB26954.1 hypothetical protein HARCEL1_04125 [Halococcoides cellulosivorans]
MTRDRSSTIRLDRRTFLAGTTAAATGTLVGLAGSAAASTGTLVVGTTLPGRVLQQDGDGWTQLGADLTPSGSVTDLLVHDGDLYAAITTETRMVEGTGRVYRWDGSSWQQIGGDLGNNVTALVAYDGAVHAGVSVGGAEVYRLDEDTWTRVLREAEAFAGAGALTVYEGDLYVGDSAFDVFGRYDGETFTVEGAYDGSCVYDFAAYDGELYAGAYRGTLFQRDGGAWTRADQADAYGELLTLATYDGSLWVGTTMGPDLGRFDGDRIELVERFDDSVVALFDAGDALYVGTGQNAAEFADSIPQATTGRLYRYAGESFEEVAPDQDFAGAVQTITRLQVNEPPTAAISVETETPVTDAPVALSGADSTDPDGEIVSYEWDLIGDGTVDATGVTVETTFEEPGAHSVSLTVTDDAGATATATATVEVALGVGLQIKPPEEPTPINPNRSNGVLPVAIDGTTVDPTAIDVDSLRVGAPDVVAAGDGAAPVHGGHRTDATGDGVTDLVVHVPIADSGFDGDESMGALRGELTDGTTLIGRDEITIVGGGPHEKGPKGPKSR